jgi:hypothetical protein
MLTSRQFGRTSAPMVPHFVHTMRGPNEGTVKSPGRWSTFMITSLPLDSERGLDRIVEARAGPCHHTPARALRIAGLSGFFTFIQSREGPEAEIRLKPCYRQTSR